MSTFHLQIVTPDGLMFDGSAESILARTAEGDVGILSGHADYVTPLSTGIMRVTLEGGEVKTAACSGGLLSVKDSVTRIAADTFEWAEDIDIERAQRARERAERLIEEKSDYEEKAAEVSLKRALVRIRAAGERM
ncbi:MAG: ATP synthase F1 subunit epsilon [Oscillospiraceae bacterium]|nr:ATP synthase F1 subunit epsilon [Oscillospiraceae bacterium]